MVFILQFVDVMYHIDWFVDTEKSLHPWDKSHLIMVFSSVQFSPSVMSDSLWPHVHWVGDAIQPSHPLSYPSPPAFNLSQHQGLFKWEFFASRGQSIGVSTSASVLPMNIQDWFPLGWMGWISLQSKGLSSLLQHHSSKALILQCSAFLIVQLSHPYMTTGKTIALTKTEFCWQSNVSSFEYAV